LITDIFSLLLERGDGTNLILNYDNASHGLGDALTSGDVFFNSHTVQRDPLPEIFAPSSWNGGASLSHLDEVVFNPTDPLMTPTIANKEVIHDPEIALEMLNDMGWRSSFIAHRSENSELVNQPLLDLRVIPFLCPRMIAAVSLSQCYLRKIRLGGINTIFHSMIRPTRAIQAHF